MPKYRLPKLACGFIVLGIPGREQSYDSMQRPHVTITRGDIRVPLTPTEARAIAAILVAEADHAETGGYRG